MENDQIFLVSGESRSSSEYVPVWKMTQKRFLNKRDDSQTITRTRGPFNVQLITPVLVGHGKTAR